MIVSAAIFNERRKRSQRLSVYPPSAGTQQKRNYDDCFVLFGYDPGLPSGGRSIIYRLASMRAQSGLAVAVVFMRAGYSYMYKLTRDKTFLPKNWTELKYWLLQPVGTSSLGMTVLGPVWRAFRRIELSKEPLEGVDIYFVSAPGDIKFNARCMYATFWPTAYFVNEFVRSNPSTRGIYIVQSAEDRPGFSGRHWEWARATYEMPLVKVVNHHSMLSRFQLSPSRLFRIGIDISTFQPFRPTSQRSRGSLLVQLRSGEDKGARYAIQALCSLVGSHPEVTIRAFGTLPTRLVPPFIEYHRYASTSEISSLYNEASIFIYPSLFEGFGIPVLEAMASGDAIVGVQGMNNPYFTEGVNGLLARPRDANDLASKIAVLIDDDSMRRAMCERNISMRTLMPDVQTMYTDFDRAVKDAQLGS